MKAFWRDEERILQTENDLREVVEAVQRLDAPTMLFLEGEQKETLVLGLGHAESVLTYVEADGRSFHSLGDPSRADRLRFWCRDQLDEFMAEMAVPERDAVRAAEQFFLSRRRPSTVRWEPDW